MVRANRDQAKRVREGETSSDFYAPVASVFKVDPFRTDEPALDRLREIVVPGETWLDLGAGGGRYALPLALTGADVIAVEPSPGMLEVLREGMAEHDISNVRIIESRWPMDDPPSADVALISHVGYDIEEIGYFLDAMDAAAGHLCVAIMLSEAPASAARNFWPPVHGLERSLLPALREFIALLFATGRFPEVREAGAREPGFYPDEERALLFLRQQLFTQVNSEKDKRLRAEIASRATPEGIPVGSRSIPLGLVTWNPLK